MKIPIVASMTTLSLATLMAVGPTSAQSHRDHGHGQTQATAAAANDLTDGEVRRIDAAAGKVTIRHGEIKSLDMPPMTMVFIAADPEMLVNLKVGDKIRFAIELQQGRMVVTRIAPIF